MTLSVHEGRIRFSAADEEVAAEAGTLLACDAGVRHSVEALGDAVCLLNVVTGSERRGLGQPEVSVNVKAAAATAYDRAGAIWTQEVSCDLNANLVRFGTGRGGEEHVSDGVEVIVVGVSGWGIIREDRGERALSAGVLVFIPKGALCATVSTSEGFAHPTVHRRRRPRHIGHQAGRVASESAHKGCPEPRRLEKAGKEPTERRAYEASSQPQSVFG